MISRFFAALTAAILLVGFVVVGQTCLGKVSKGLAEDSDAVCTAFSEEKTEEGKALLKDLRREFESSKGFLLLFVNDTRVHEICRALSRAERLSEEGDFSPALEALSDLAATLRELSETHRPMWENIF